MAWSKVSLIRLGENSYASPRASSTRCFQTMAKPRTATQPAKTSQWVGPKVWPSTDAEARATIDQMNRTNTEMFNRLLEGVATEDIPNITFGLNAALSSSLAGVLAGMMTLEESLSRVEWVARTLVADR